MKQITLTTIPLLCAAFAPLCADAQGKNMSPAEQQQMYMNEMNKITPSAEPSVTRWADPYLTADFIWWRAHEDGLDYALTGVTPIIHNADKGHVHHPHFSYEPGFKVGFGLKFRHDGWDFFAQYTRLTFDKSETKNHAKRDADGDSNVMSNIPMPWQTGDQITFFAEEAKAKWSLDFNVLDLELGRNFWISKWLTLRPFIGMKFDWTDQDFNVEYENVSSTPFQLLNGSEIEMKMDQDQWAVGIRAGLNSAYYMWKKLCIYGDFAISGILNDFDVSRKDEVETATREWNQNHIHKSAHPVTAVLEWGLGLRFETAFHNDDFLFQLQAGWEEQIWFNQNQFINFSNSSTSDLNFEGLTIKAAFYF